VRIIAGSLKGKQLGTAKPALLRPTTDKVREAIFAILTPCLSGGIVLDLFAGTGSLGIEAISRGMEYAVFVEKSPLALGILKKNIITCRIEAQCCVIGASVSKGLRLLAQRAKRFDLIFLDPPYRDQVVGKTLRDIGSAGILISGGIIVAEHAQQESLADAYGPFSLDDQRHYGQTVISFFTQHP